MKVLARMMKKDLVSGFYSGLHVRSEPSYLPLPKARHFLICPEAKLEEYLDFMCL